MDEIAGEVAVEMAAAEKDNGVRECGRMASATASILLFLGGVEAGESKIASGPGQWSAAASVAGTNDGGAECGREGGEQVQPCPRYLWQLWGSYIAGSSRVRGCELVHNKPAGV
jgi:hypothetical protein